MYIASFFIISGCRLHLAAIIIFSQLSDPLDISFIRFMIVVHMLVLIEVSNFSLILSTIHS